MSGDSLCVVRNQPFIQLKTVLDHCVLNDANLAPARSLLLRPLELLGDLADNAVDALSNSLHAMDRTRFTIQMAAADTFDIRNALDQVLYADESSNKSFVK